MLQGRKRAGGIRLGEMERDALIAHGTSFLLQDRLMNCSDYSIAWVCRSCGSLISLGYDDISHGEITLGSSKPHGFVGPNGEYCRLCHAGRELGTPPKLYPDSQKDILSMKLLQANTLTSDKHGFLDIVAIPYVFRYLCAELASMGIAISLEVS